VHRLVVLYPTPVDPEQFREYYVNNHLPLTSKLPGLRGYRYSFEVSGGGGESPYFAVFEADFPDRETMIAALGSEEGRAVLADVDNYATGGIVPIDYEPVESAVH
jgi:uncharacterized protein (TIGR02118 family)